MFSCIEKCMQPLVVAESEKFVLRNDRSRFDTIFAVVERFSIDNRGVIGGINGINMLADVPKSKDSYIYEIYIEDPADNSKKLADAIYAENHKHISIDTLRVDTKMKNKIYELWIEGRPIVKIYALIEYRGIKLFLLLNPVRAHGYFTDDDKIYAMSPEIQLLDIYRRLYNPYPASRLGLSYETYDVLLANENKLYNVISADIISRAKGIEEDIMSVSRAEGGDEDIEGGDEDIEGGDEDIEGGDEDIEGGDESAEGGDEDIEGGEENNKGARRHHHKKDNKNQQRNIIHQVSNLLLKEIENTGMEVVIIGDYALNQILTDYAHKDRLQILTTESIDNLKKIVESIVKKSNFIDDDYKKVFSVRYPLNLPNDIHIEKSSIYLGGGNNQLFLCDVFNSLSYEVVPYVVVENSKLKWGNILVCMRFKFIDLYVSRLINNLYEGNDKFIISRIDQISRTIVKLREKFISILHESPEDILQLKNYAGTFVQPNVLLMGKLEAAPGGRKFYAKYYPTTKKPEELIINGINA